MRTITFSLQQLMATCTISLMVAGLGRVAFEDLRARTRLAECVSVGEGIRRFALAELSERDEVLDRATNPPELPESGLATLDPRVPGWRSMARTLGREVPGQFAVISTSTGFRVEARCRPRVGDEPVVLVGTEEHAMGPAASGEEEDVDPLARNDAPSAR